MGFTSGTLCRFVLWDTSFVMLPSWTVSSGIPISRHSYIHRFMGELQAYLWQITLLHWKQLRRSPKNRAKDAVTLVDRR